MRVQDYLNAKYHEQNHEAVDVLSPIALVLETAREKFSYHLSTDDKAKSYLQDVRGLSQKTIDRFQLGYAPDGYTRLVSQSKTKRWQLLLQKSLNRSLTPQELEQQLNAMMLLAGLTARKETGEMYDRFRNRIIIPILDKRGQVISFGGRIFNEESSAKYMNGSDSPLFNKREVLFNLDAIHSKYLNSQVSLVAPKKLDSINAVEGYMDVIGMYEFGLENCVGTMGTAISQKQIETLFHYTDHINLCFDGDSAGQKAAKRATYESLGCLSGERMVTITILPDGHDPDSFLTSKSTQSDKLYAKELLEEEFEAGIKVTDFLKKCLIEDHLLDDNDTNLLQALLIEKASEIPSGSTVRKELEKHIAMGTAENHQLSKEEMVEYVIAHGRA